jgi:hypothetical protein
MNSRNGASSNPSSDVLNLIVMTLLSMFEFEKRDNFRRLRRGRLNRNGSNPLHARSGKRGAASLRATYLPSLSIPKSERKGVKGVLLANAHYAEIGIMRVC